MPNPSFATIDELLAAAMTSYVKDIDVVDVVHDDDEYMIDQTVGLVTGRHIWDALWRFGLIEDEAVTRLGCLWQPDGHIENDYYIPDDHDTIEDCVTIDTPNTVGVVPRFGAS